jgi:hypothetical protein
MVKNIIILLVLVAVAHAELLFVHEYFRHGARASDVDYDTAVGNGTNKDFIKDFPNGVGQLTASGMRQHYLLGSYIRKEYIDRLGFLNSTYDMSELYVQSTRVPRTIISAECHLLGMYPLGTVPDLTESQVDAAITPIKISDLKEIQKELGLSPTAKSYQPIAVHSSNVMTQDDVIGYANCPLMMSDYTDRLENVEFWKDCDQKYGPLIYNKIIQTFGMSKDDFHFMLAIIMIDILKSEKFEGLKPRNNFTTEEWEIMNEMTSIMFMNSLSEQSSRVMASRSLYPIVQAIKKFSGKEYSATALKPYETAKMIIFSSHDLHISQLLTWLNPINLVDKNIYFASNILIELHIKDSKECSTDPSDD